MKKCPNPYNNNPKLTSKIGSEIIGSRFSLSMNYEENDSIKI
jgi:hypothetical protein